MLKIKDEWYKSSVYIFAKDMDEEEKEVFKERHDLTEEEFEELLEYGGIVELPKFESDVDEIRTILEETKDNPLFYVEYDSNQGIIHYLEFSEKPIKNTFSKIREDLKTLCEDNQVMRDAIDRYFSGKRKGSRKP